MIGTSELVSILRFLLTRGLLPPWSFKVDSSLLRIGLCNKIRVCIRIVRIRINSAPLTDKVQLITTMKLRSLIINLIEYGSSDFYQVQFFSKRMFSFFTIDVVTSFRGHAALENLNPNIECIECYVTCVS